ncbi:hypothetical protein PPL_03364 [Heterostelium album PN500]|uniref:Uncharacterized protein n=1 Tax=Heterostelium pallidum (strain ATCC 26659 / Pp 5 / PN500) TaxID=670386 RepID=D3B4N9_HETP5|nr:hypothetical protein PPL_03364 [Heterostelium album PN500]EFA84287.1 hypothetical protein PPL_03364 [Heterostelium album PN500]|eukprot:XP_020436403.1 hypothetical protein PPL_03364 [Heterostelium album PN500]
MSSHSHRLTEREKISVIIDLDNGLTQEEIGLKYNCSHSTVSRLKKKYEETNSVQNIKPPGRKREYSLQDELDIKNIFLNNYCPTLKAVKTKYNETYHKSLSVTTIRRIMIDAGLVYSSRNKRKKQLLDASKADTTKRRQVKHRTRRTTKRYQN